MTERGPYGDYYGGEVKASKPKMYLYTVEWSVYKLISQRDFGSSSTWTHEVKTKKFLDKNKAEVFLKSVTEAYNLVLPGANKGSIKTEEIED